MAAPVDAAPRGVPGTGHPTDRRLGWVGLGVAVGSFLASLIVAPTVGAAYAAARGLTAEEATKDLGYSVVTALGLWVGFLVLPVLWSRGHGGPRRLLGLSARWVDLPLGLAVGLGSSGAATGLSTLVLTKRQTDDLEIKAREIIDRAHGGPAVALLVLVLCVGTPIAEEVFFRGLLFRSLHRLAGVVVAALLGGLVFGLVHYDPSPVDAVVVVVQLALLGLFGLALCILAHRTGRLGAGFVAHAAFNAVTVVTLLAQR
ncbi:MAG: CPBP family intramembrane glutamic endopeptidase [Acidimicrobiales bacterium]